MDSKYSMISLKQKLSGLLDVIPKQSEIIYADYPLYGNVGDLFIMKGTEAFFKEHGIRVRKRWNPDNFPVGRKLDPNLIIVCQGGGNFGDLYPYYQGFREKIVQTYPNHKIVILPQSIYFQNKDNLKRTAEIFSKHANLHIITREKASYATAQAYFTSNHIKLLPDMAHQLFPVVPTQQPINQKLRFIRTDHEANKELQEDAKAESYDWRTVLSASDRRTIAFLQTLNVLNKKAGNPLPIAYIWEKYSDYIVKKAIRFFSRYESVETSRLHGHILSSLLQKENTVIDNSYGKNANYYHTWMEGVPNTRLIQNASKKENLPAHM
ncbi:polysaccharide pyruvyl transferase family protein [Bacillus inaquosorum]|uniref:polysaccharide pyruvyl transferase family protein n=1 Tax=Bacillus inaquosorum TaxID=483913 RepID=UPI002282ADC5|nr:polysaccharide pyruvyl transferase family protein [Bacillus inaquosorum]MCY9013565.1 polysaccharide pyruvyl transferase family protein [Bacillus inaquosorum]MCY9040284.1 polysaccharide pyruvyl transferase family protein [Bacillus inaquosorum]MCY9069017.1 polysaccharide pyruvyl transferase family protein [Bacillus inaquosorum]MCY9105127.1 polysaccharide pyruvyl transferase family protein [Bacillus inaquosorum]MCY9121393.1 polysaccharide pyruvyl transferase family protein [Bacillus inaquosoru